MTDELLEIRTTGAGPDVVLLHGAPTAPTHLDPLAAALAPSHRVHVVSMPGYDRSARLSPYALDAVHERLERGLAGAVTGHVALVGFSGGAYHAFALASRGALRVRSIVSLGGFATMSDQDRPLMRQFAGMLRAGVDAGPILVERMLSAAYRATHPEEVAEVLGWMRATTNEVLADELEAFAGSADLRPAIAALDVPILARVGALDVAAPPANSEQIFAVARNGALEIVDGAGHALLHEDRDATFAAIARAVAG